jgi:hypothetical protein
MDPKQFNAIFSFIQSAPFKLAKGNPAVSSLLAISARIPTTAQKKGARSGAPSHRLPVIYCET